MALSSDATLATGNLSDRSVAFAAIRGPRRQSAAIRYSSKAWRGSRAMLGGPWRHRLLGPRQELPGPRGAAVPCRTVRRIRPVQDGRAAPKITHIIGRRSCHGPQARPGSAADAAIAMRNTLDLEGRPQDTRVVVAMSGGVDSAVTAALLKAEGYDVVGVTLQLYDHGAATHRKGACCAGQDIHDARAVAERIGIPHYVLDFESRFKEMVIDRFAASYVAGETPVPCVDCNQSIKFRDLLTTARELGAKVLATGHYVASRALPEGGRALYRAREAERDQSYFLFATTREQLDLLRFPLGDKSKAETRDLARRFDLPVADKQDSQDICFVPSGRYPEVIARLRPGAAEPGDIVDLAGRVLGRHSGIIHFTVGQRRGLGIAAGHQLYVVRLDASSRRVVVRPREALRTSRMRLREVNWLGEDTIDHALW